MWLRLKEGDIVHAAIDISSIGSVAKHWTGRRLELCLGEGCPYCLAGKSKRWRYHARLVSGGESYDWEFGEESMTDLNSLAHDTNWVHISIARIGGGQHTRYRISEWVEGSEGGQLEDSTGQGADRSETKLGQRGEVKAKPGGEAVVAGETNRCSGTGLAGEPNRHDETGRSGGLNRYGETPLAGEPKRQCEAKQSGEAKSCLPPNKYTRGRYGHLVRR